MQQDETEVSFGREVAQFRNARGLSQRAFADALTEAGFAVDSSAVSRIEKGTRDVRLTEAVTIARVLHVELDRLVGSMQSVEDRAAARLRAMADAYHALESAIENYFDEQVRLGRVPAAEMSKAQRAQIERTLEFPPERLVKNVRTKRHIAGKMSLGTLELGGPDEMYGLRFEDRDDG